MKGKIILILFLVVISSISLKAQISKKISDEILPNPYSNIFSQKKTAMIHLYCGPAISNNNKTPLFIINDKFADDLSKIKVDDIKHFTVLPPDSAKKL